MNTGDLNDTQSVSASKAVTEQAVDEFSSLKLFPSGSIVIALYGATIGRLGILSESGTVNQACCVMQTGPGLSGTFLFYSLMSFRDRIVTLASGGGQPNISQEIIRQLRIPVPTLPEQRAIAGFLDWETAKIDALVEEQRRLIALLKEKRQAVISHAVTKGLDPAAPLKPSGIDWLGDIPAHWEAVPLKYLTSFRSGGTPSKTNLNYWDGDIPWVSARDLKTATITDSTYKIKQAALDEGAASLVDPGSILVLVRGMTLAHSFPVCVAGVSTAINQDLKALVPFETVNGAFLAWSLRGLAEQSLSRIDEAGHGTKALRMEAWISMEIPMPPKDEQASIAEALTEKTTALDALTSEAERAITLLQERRSALISAAVTGKIDVRDTTTNSTEAA